jgi:hypothetical protein
MRKLILAFIASGLAALGGEMIMTTSAFANGTDNAGHCSWDGTYHTAFGISFKMEVCEVRNLPAPLMNGTSGSSGVKGYDSGEYNHFICQEQGSPSTFWIYGRADNGLWGWLNETNLVDDVNTDYIGWLPFC